MEPRGVAVGRAPPQRTYTEKPIIYPRLALHAVGELASIDF